MTFYNREGILYVRINGQRLSTKLEDIPKNRKLVTSYYRNDEFFNKFNLKQKEPQTIISLCEEVLKEKEETLKPSSYRAYERMYNCRILPFFDNWIVSEIKPIDIKRFYKSFTDRSTLVTCNAVLKPAFELAVLNEYIELSPMASVSLPRFKSKYSSNPFSLDEVKEILQKAEDQFKNLLGIAFFTGMRAGELMGLKWENIDFHNETINIVNNHVEGRNQEPKTKSSKAMIDLPIEALPFFKDQRLKTGLKEYVFYSRKNNQPFFYSANINIMFNSLLDKLGYKRRGFHQIRHTFASLKLSYGERLEWVSFMLRHKSPAITQNVYYKYIPRKKEKRVVFEIDELTQNWHSKIG